eukprot:5144910-Prymnesium_polylepis.1
MHLPRDNGPLIRGCCCSPFPKAQALCGTVRSDSSAHALLLGTHDAPGRAPRAACGRAGGRLRWPHLHRLQQSQRDRLQACWQYRAADGVGPAPRYPPRRDGEDRQLA